MFRRLYREYVAITDLLLQRPDAKIKDARLIVTRRILVRLMDQHPYLTSRDKILAWRELHWLDCEDGRSRKRIRENGQIRSVLQIDLTVCDQLRQLDREILDKLYREYIAISSLLLRQPDRWIKDNRLIVTQPVLTQLMDQHPYLTSRAKVGLWRRLRWIESQGDRSRKRIVRPDGSRISAIQIDLGVYKRLAYCKAETDADQAKNRPKKG